MKKKHYLLSTVKIFSSIWLAFIKIWGKTYCVCMGVLLVSFVTNKLSDNEMQHMHHWLILPATDLCLQYKDDTSEGREVAKNVMERPMHTFPLWLKLNVTGWNATFKAASKITVTVYKEGCWEKYFYAFVHRLMLQCTADIHSNEETVRFHACYL
jgi:hypothetical protein